MTSRPWAWPSGFSGAGPRHDECPVPPPDAPAIDGSAVLADDARRELAGAFELESVLARSAGSIVYAAREGDGDRRVALRVLRRPRMDTGLDGRLRDLVRATALDHPHIVPVYRAGTTTRLVWYSMKLVDGRSLAALLAERGRLNLAATLRIAEQVANALAYAHRRGVTHGDVRPANVLVDRDWALVADFGIGRLLDRYRARDVKPGGAPRAAYRAPEDAPGDEPTVAGDQYALAATIWECLTGTPPIGGPVGAPPDVPPPAAAALARALCPRPVARYPSVLDFVAALGTPDAAPAAVAPPRYRPPSNAGQRVILIDREPRRRHRLGTAAVITVVGLVAWPLLQMPSTRVSPAPPAAPTAPPPAPAPTPARAQPPVATLPTLPPLPPVERERREERPAPSPVAPASSPATPSPTRERPPQATATGESGSLVISSMPWGQLFVDGQPAGTTPKSGLTLSPGPHRVEIVRAGYRRFGVEIHVSPGQEVRLVNIGLEAQVP